MSFNLRNLVVAMMGAGLSLTAWAVNPFQIKDIRLEGLQKVDAGSVFASLPVRVGDTYTDEVGSNTIRKLFELGNFQDVQVRVDGDVLVVVLQESPSVDKITLDGFKEIGKEQLTAALREMGVVEGRPYNKALVDRAEQEIKKQYVDRGFYDAKLSTTTTPSDKGQLNLVMKMTEGFVSKIQSIKIVGAKEISESTLLSEMNLQDSGLMTWYSKNDRYSAAKLNADLEEIRSYYTRRGYLDFKVLSTNVEVTPDKRGVNLIVNISEGKAYTVGGVTLEGNYLRHNGDFEKLIKVKTGDLYNSDDVAATVTKITETFGNLGYAFAKVDVLSATNADKNQVALKIRAEPGQRAYVRNINIIGNRRTRDEVIRRELRQLESSWYNGEKVRLSRDRVNRLGYFSDVGIDVQEVPDSPDQADINLKVAEVATGNLSLSAGYSSTDKFSVGAGIKQENVFGSGNYLGLDINTSKLNRNLSLTSVDPYFTKDGVSRSFSLGYRTTKPTTAQEGDYQLVTKSAAVNFGFPLSETDKYYLGIGVENIKINPGNQLPYSYQEYIRNFGESSYALPMTVSWARDERDNQLTTSNGKYYALGLTYSPWKEAKYWNVTANYQQFIPLTKKFTFAYNADVAYGRGVSNRPYPVFKNFYVGGIGSVRGFESGTVGPVDGAGNYVGGAQKYVVNAQLFMPFPGVGNDKSMRVFVFADAGVGLAEKEKFQSSNVRSSVGLGLSWISPIGPLSFSYARPVRKLEHDKIQKFQFQIGTSF